jgi:hypothetical protein
MLGKIEVENLLKVLEINDFDDSTENTLALPKTQSPKTQLLIS